MQLNDDERLRRWRLLLGSDAETEMGFTLTGGDLAMDRALGMIYGQNPGFGKSGVPRGGMGSSAPNVARWLGDIRQYFPSSVVQVMQKDALEKLNLRQMLLEPEMLSAMQPDVHLVATLIALKSVIPLKTKETARMVVRQVVDDLMAKLKNPMKQAVIGSLNRAVRNHRPRHNEIDWNRTIRANLKHYQKEYKTIVPERLIGYGRKRSALRDIILCVDQSGSMASSVVYSSIFGAVLASLPSVSTQMILFDTSVVDLTAELSDPVDLLFGAQLGGGTDINRALTYCQTLISRPSETILVLISDLYEGGNQQEMLRRAAAISASGVQMVSLLALSDQGTPSFSHENASRLAALGIPAFACTPDQFPDLMAAAITKQDLTVWAGERGINASRAG